MLAHIITIGDELLIGQVVDTNSAFICQELNNHNIVVDEVVSVHDDRQQIVSALDNAMQRADLVLLTGGLGPTKDDITKLTLARYFGGELVENDEVRQHIFELYSSRPQVFNSLTATQWLVPQNAIILPNRVGSAPLMVWMRHVGKREVIVASMPGVPYEMEIAMREQVVPFVEAHRTLTNAIVHRHVMVYGIPESTLALQIAQWEAALPETMHLAYLPKDGIVRLRLSSYGEASAAQLDERVSALLPLLGDAVVATEDKPLEVLVGEQLLRLHATVGSAESCTGGKIAALLSKHAGSSDFYKGSVVAYSNEVKMSVLGVEKTTLEEWGAVSEQTVIQMAQGARRVLGTDYAVATSGIAGPGGGTADKPVGTIWTAVATPEKVYTKLLHLGTLRDKNTDRTTVAVLVNLLRILQNK